MSQDDLQQKLMNAKLQQEQAANLPTDPRELAERKKYHDLYNRIYPMLMKSSFDFAEVADVAGLKVNRMRDALLSRLTLDEMVQLVGCQPGSCYVCGAQIRGYYKQEPFCILCLSSIETAIASLYPVDSYKTRVKDQHQSVKTPTQPAILDDLLACGAPLMAVTGDPYHTRPDWLKILDASEEESANADEVERFLSSERAPILGAFPQAELRSFGFQRAKSPNPERNF